MIDQNIADMHAVEIALSQFNESIVLPFVGILQQISDIKFQRSLAASLVRLEQLECLPLTSMVAIAAANVSEALGTIWRQLKPRLVHRVQPWILLQIEYLENQIRDFHVKLDKYVSLSDRSVQVFDTSLNPDRKIEMIVAEALIIGIERSSLDLRTCAYIEVLAIASRTKTYSNVTSQELELTVKNTVTHLFQTLEILHVELIEQEQTQYEIRQLTIDRLRLLEQRRATFGTFNQPIYLVNNIAQSEESLARLDEEIQALTSDTERVATAISMLSTLLSS